LRLNLNDTILYLRVIDCWCSDSPLGSAWVVIHDLRTTHLLLTNLRVHVQHRVLVLLLLLQLGVNGLILLWVHHRLGYLHPHLAHLWRHLKLRNLHLPVRHWKPILDKVLTLKLWKLRLGDHAVHLLHLHSVVWHYRRHFLLWRLLLGSTYILELKVEKLVVIVVLLTLVYWGRRHQ
jgi:hypothetical protein